MANPTLSEGVFERERAFASTGAMTVQGSAIKAGVLGALCLGSSLVTWNLVGQGGLQAAMPWMATGIIGGLICAIILWFKAPWAPVLSPIYAVLEGLFLGGISAMFNNLYDGIVLKAICITFGIMFAMLIAYQSGAIRATDKFRKGVIAATCGVMLIYLITFLLQMFGVQIPYIFSGGPISIGISVVIIIIASLNFVLDFDNMEKGEAYGAPKYMEWYCAWGLLVTVIWLYLEVLRLLMYLADD